MKRYFIVTGTITYAIKGRDALRRNGISAEIRRLTNFGEGYGCGYGISAVGNPDFMLDILEKNSVKHLLIKEDF